MSFEGIDIGNIPEHVAVIMDGNGRWAQKKGGIRSMGHQEGVNAVRQTVEGCVELGVGYLTLYAFSTENWNRPKEEVDALMTILVNSITAEYPTMLKNNIRLTTIGNTSDLPDDCKATLFDTIKKTENHTGLVLNLALSYSGRWDIMRAVKEIALDVEKGVLTSGQIDEECFKKRMSTSFLPDPDLLIRTSGEFRLSNFLLWEVAYSEIFISDVLWPDFDKSELAKAIKNYQKRERRFGLTGDQVKN